MKTRIYSVHDVKAQAYINPFFLPNDAMAIRAFAQCVNDPTHAFGQNPADYTLFHLGTFDSDNASITSHAPHSLGNALEFVRFLARESQPDLPGLDHPGPRPALVANGGAR